MTGRNMARRIFDLAHSILVIVIIRGVPTANRVPPPIFIANSVSGNLNFISVGISNVGSLVPPGSSRV